jgi:hypothetical protein
VPRYFFNIDGAAPDTEGTEIKDLAEAKCEGVRMAGRIICDQAGDFWDRAEWNMTVSDATRLALFTLHVVGVEAAAAPRLRKPSS